MAIQRREQIATRALDAGLEVMHDGIRLTPQDIVARARDGVDCVGLSILSGSHLAMTREVLALMKAAGLRAPVVVGGIIPPADAEALRAEGVAAVYTPKDFAVNAIIADIVGHVERAFEDERRKRWKDRRHFPAQ